MNSTLFILSGLPASGKSALAKRIAREYRAVYLRIDTVEQALRDLCDFDAEGEGYELAYRIAADNLALSLNVVADSCNPIYPTRREWEKTAEENSASFINIEVVCSDKDEHRMRVETRKSEIAGLKLPGWEDVVSREYHPWENSRITIDTANRSVEESFTELAEKVSLLMK